MGSAGAATADEEPAAADDTFTTDAIDVLVYGTDVLLLDAVGCFACDCADAAETAPAAGTDTALVSANAVGLCRRASAPCALAGCSFSNAVTAVSVGA